nr:PfkB family carbohydrate kinase [Micromonospora sp. HNM0581]
MRWGGVMNNMACAMGARGAGPALVTADYTGELASAVATHLAGNGVRWTPLPFAAPLPLFHAELADGSVREKWFIGGAAIDGLDPTVLAAGRSLFDTASVLIGGTDATAPALDWLAAEAAKRGVPFWLLSADPTETGKLRPARRDSDLTALNLLELGRWAGRPLDSMVDVTAAATELAGAGHCLVTLGGQGALLTGPDGTFRQAPPSIDDPALTVGAGDVLLGCLLTAHLGGQDWPAALQEATKLTGAFLAGPASAERPYRVLRDDAGRRPRFTRPREVRTICGPAPPAAARSTSENGEAQVDDLGFCTEPPDGIEPSTYAPRPLPSPGLSSVVTNDR